VLSRRAGQPARQAILPGSDSPAITPSDGCSQ
jgi:hypothetical protein